jgi:hypothetical protein
MPAAGWRALARWYEDPRLLAWWEAHVGARLLLPPPRWRATLSVVGLAVCAFHVLRSPGTPSASARLLIVAPVLLGLGVLTWAVARRYDRLPAALRRRPQLALHAGFWALLLALWALPAGGDGAGLLRLLLFLLPFALWRLGYLLKSGQRGKSAGTALGDHLFYQWPLWQVTNIPSGKGFDHLSRVQAQTPAAVARTQLGGLHLLALSVCWWAVSFLMSGMVFGDPGHPLAPLAGGWSLAVPRIDELIRRRAELPWLLAWNGILWDLLWNTTRMAARGHAYIGALRVLGFNAMRNTDRPLLSQSIAEFWNRYYYYYKELLVEFFFYPTYGRVKLPGAWRAGVAVFAAAGLGNLYYHLIEADGLLDGDLARVWLNLQSRVVYCLLLGTGIAISMMREQRRRGHAAAPVGRLRRLRRIAGVWLFFGVIHIWAEPSAHPTLAERTALALRLFGFGWLGW